jgi:hypothetical protein
MTNNTTTSSNDEIKKNQEKTWSMSKHLFILKEEKKTRYKRMILGQKTWSMSNDFERVIFESDCQQVINDFVILFVWEWTWHFALNM